jgi:hypothetical protein
MPRQRACLVSLFSDARSQQPGATKIQTLAASLIIRVLVITNKAALRCRGENTKCLVCRENTKCLMCFSHFLAFTRLKSQSKHPQSQKAFLAYHMEQKPYCFQVPFARKESLAVADRLLVATFVVILSSTAGLQRLHTSVSQEEREVDRSARFTCCGS